MRDYLSDPHRLRALETAALLDTPAEAAFDRLTNLASRILGVPVALVSLVTPDRQFFKSQCGLPSPYSERRETPLSHSFCQYVVEDGAALIVEDAREDERLAANLAIPDLGVIAYAGYPIRARERRRARLVLRDRRPAARVVAGRPRGRSPSWPPPRRTSSRCGREAVAAGDAGRRLQRALVPEPPPLPGRGRLRGLPPRRAALPARRRLLRLRGAAGRHDRPARRRRRRPRPGGRGVRDVAALGLAGAAARAALARGEGEPAEHDRARAAAADRACSRPRCCARSRRTARAAQAINAGHPPLVRLDASGAREAAIPPCPPLGVDPGRDLRGRRRSSSARAPRCSPTPTASSRAAPRPAPPSGSGPRPVLELAGAMHAEGADGDALLTALVELAARSGGEPPDDDVAALLVAVP